MGYTTKFVGEFQANKPISITLIGLLEKLASEELTASDIEELCWPTVPDHYFQWEVTKDRKGVQWNGGEKFYDYVEWLQWLIDVLKKKQHGNIMLSGQIEYRGEDSRDWGFLKIVDGKAVKVENPLKAWAEIPTTVRSRVLKKLTEAELDLDHEETKAFASALNLLGTTE